MKLSLGFVFLALGAAPSLVAQEYRIQMRRPAKAGQQFQLSCQYHETIRVSASVPGRTSPEFKTNYVAEFDGLIKVQETDPSGRIVKASCTISNCVRVEDDKYRRRLLPQDTVVALSAGEGNPQFLVKGKPVDLEAQKILAVATQLRAGGPAPDEIFGTDSPKKVGESWDINPEPMVGVLKMQNLGITDPDIQGRSTLEQFVKVGDIDCLELASKIYLKKFLPPLPPGVQVKQAFGALRLAGKYPLDASMAALQQSMDFDMSFIAQARFGTNTLGVTTKTSTAIKLNLERKYLK